MTAMVQTRKSSKKIVYNTFRDYILPIALFLFFLVVVGTPILMAVCWSFVNPDFPWSYPDILPKNLSLFQWNYVFKYTDILQAIATSYTLAPVATFVCFLFSLPTAYALGRNNFPGKEALRILILLPIILPGMVVAMFLSRVFDYLGLSQNFIGLVLGHMLMGMPYMLRLLSTSFEAIPQDIVDAASNLGAPAWVRFREVLIPMVLPGIFAGAVFTFITSLEEFALTFVIGTPTFQTIPTILFAFLGYHFVRTNAPVVSLLLLIPNTTLLFIADRMLKTDFLSTAYGKL